MATKAIVSDTTAYASIVKFEEQEDGTVLAYGKATDATLDADEQICDPEWLKRAMPEWFKYGNIREQHSSVAAGVATEYEETEDGHYITAHIVDPSSAKKVKTGVLKGFSIGIRRPRVIKDNKAAGGRIIDGQIVEISVVDRPANPSCMLTVAKASKGELKAVKSVFTELTKGSPDQPRDENGRFASSDGGDTGSDTLKPYDDNASKENIAAAKVHLEESYYQAEEIQTMITYAMDNTEYPAVSEANAVAMNADMQNAMTSLKDSQESLNFGDIESAKESYEAAQDSVMSARVNASRADETEIKDALRQLGRDLRTDYPAAFGEEYEEDKSISKGSPDQPRDENGRFASSDGGDASGDAGDSKEQEIQRGVEQTDRILMDSTNAIMDFLEDPSTSIKESGLLREANSAVLHSRELMYDGDYSQASNVLQDGADRLNPIATNSRYDNQEDYAFLQQYMRDAADSAAALLNIKSISKGSEDQPRDENGRFASFDGFSSGEASVQAEMQRIRDSFKPSGENRFGTADSVNWGIIGEAAEEHYADAEGIMTDANFEFAEADELNSPDLPQIQAGINSIKDGMSDLENSMKENSTADSAFFHERASASFADASQSFLQAGRPDVASSLRNLAQETKDTANEISRVMNDKYLKSISTKENIMKADAILEMSKEWAGSDIKKFDQAAFDNARRALATLIQVEAGEMAEGHSEAHSLTSLLSAVHALMEYSEGEVAEGETMFMSEMKMADKPEKAMAEEEEMCPECEKSMKECACETGKCLECGCHEPANNHGRDDVTTAVVVSDKSQVSDIQTMVEDIVKELLTNPSVGEEITTKAAESERIEALETELAQVKSLAAPSGPKRFAAVSNTTANVNKTKAAIYRAKAATTLDKSLANGYLALAIDLEKSESQ